MLPAQILLGGTCDQGQDDITDSAPDLDTKFKRLICKAKQLELQVQTPVFLFSVMSPSQEKIQKGRQGCMPRIWP
jgi:hypothetical protein